MKVLSPDYNVVAAPWAATIAAYWWQQRLRGATWVSRIVAACLRGRDCHLGVGEDIISLPCADPITYLYLAGGVLSTICTNVLRHVITSGAVVYDIGANYGLFGWQVLKAVGPEGRVVFFEPNPLVTERLKANLAANNICHAEVVESAVSDQEGLMELLTPLGQQSGLARIEAIIHERPGWRHQTVPATTVDAYARQSSLWPNVLKLDVEGHELSVLRGAVETLARSRPTIILELDILGHQVTEKTRRDVLSLLQGHGYSYFQAVTPYGLCPYTDPDTIVSMSDLIAATEDLGDMDF